MHTHKMLSRSWVLATAKQLSSSACYSKVRGLISGRSNAYYSKTIGAICRLYETTSKESNVYYSKTIRLITNEQMNVYLWAILFFQNDDLFCSE